MPTPCSTTMSPALWQPGQGRGGHGHGEQRFTEVHSKSSSRQAAGPSPFAARRQPLERRRMNAPFHKPPASDSKTAAAGADRGTARVLRGGRPGDRDRRARARALRPAGLRPPRDRPQPLRGRRAQGQGRGVRRGARRSARRRARGVQRARGARRRCPAEAEKPRPRLPRRDLPAGEQGPPPGRASGRSRAPHRIRRPQGPSRGDRHLRPGSRRADDAGRDGWATWRRSTSRPTRRSPS